MILLSLSLLLWGFGVVVFFFFFFFISHGKWLKTLLSVAKRTSLVGLSVDLTTPSHRARCGPFCGPHNAFTQSEMQAFLWTSQPHGATTLSPWHASQQQELLIAGEAETNSAAIQRQQRIQLIPSNCRLIRLMVRAHDAGICKTTAIDGSGFLVSSVGTSPDV